MARGGNPGRAATCGLSLTQPFLRQRGERPSTVPAGQTMQISGYSSACLPKRGARLCQRESGHSEGVPDPGRKPFHAGRRPRDGAQRGGWAPTCPRPLTALTAMHTLTTFTTRPK
jgi:hypothetical protein